MNYYVVIDTNVLVSAMLKWESVPGSIIDFAFEGIIIPLINRKILDEYRTVLSRSKFGLPKDVVDAIVKAMELRGLNVDESTLDIELPDPNDRVFFEVVMEERKTGDAYLVTGNMKHFPSKPFVVTPRQMLDIILNTPDVFD